MKQLVTAVILLCCCFCPGCKCNSDSTTAAVPSTVTDVPSDPIQDLSTLSLEDRLKRELTGKWKHVLPSGAIEELYINCSDKVVIKHPFAGKKHEPYVISKVTFDKQNRLFLITAERDSRNQTQSIKLFVRKSPKVNIAKYGWSLAYTRPTGYSGIDSVPFSPMPFEQFRRRFLLTTFLFSASIMYLDQGEDRTLLFKAKAISSLITLLTKNAFASHFLLAPLRDKETDQAPPDSEIQKAFAHLALNVNTSYTEAAKHEPFHVFFGDNPSDHSGLGAILSVWYFEKGRPKYMTRFFAYGSPEYLAAFGREKQITKTTPVRFK